MTVAKNLDAYEQGETQSWAWPLYAFVAWLAGILGYVTRFKRIRRTHSFKSDWRDSWEGLRQSEWLRDQVIAQGVAQLIANQPLQLDDTKITLEPPATYGGPCPRSPFEMNRRFLALARWATDPEAIIRERFSRLVDNPRAAHGSTDALRAAHHEVVGAATARNAGARIALILSSDRRERPSKGEGGLTYARGPPGFPRLPIPDCLLPRWPPPARSPPRAYSGRMRMFRYHTRSPWSCSAMWPFANVPNSGHCLNFVAATFVFQASSP
jgi:hypothetical protein